MKKLLLIAFIVLSFNAKSQSKFYGLGNLIFTQDHLGASASFGYVPFKIIGFGLGVEGLGNYKSKMDNPAFASLFVESRIFLYNKGKLIPTLSINYGAFLYDDNYKYNNGKDVINITQTGKNAIGGTVGIIIHGKKHLRSGLYIGGLFRHYVVKTESYPKAAGVPDNTTGTNYGGFCVGVKF